MGAFIYYFDDEQYIKEEPEIEENEQPKRKMVL